MEASNPSVHQTGFLGKSCCTFSALSMHIILRPAPVLHVAAVVSHRYRAFYTIQYTDNPLPMTSHSTTQWGMLRDTERRRMRLNQSKWKGAITYTKVCFREFARMFAKSKSAAREATIGRRNLMVPSPTCCRYVLPQPLQQSHHVTVPVARSFASASWYSTSS